MPTILELESLPIRVTADGRWLHGDTPLHPRVAVLFAHCVVPDPDGGYHLEVGRSRAPVEVADAAFQVTRLDLEAGPDGGLAAARLGLSDGTTEPLDPATLMAGPDNALYCRVVRHGLSVPCRFPPSLYHRLALHVEARGDGFVLPLGGADHPIAPYDPRPREAGAP